ncbi:hemicentin-2-like [Hemibagrus wyckioides]|uniref:hemicentin-2-like n=1 Tax=Hemibagrus wyckioides TaxID=337641 RepID=UPI00266C79C2|nr:hemicentin-2-like [Hemibagrus wyckioides]
MLYFRTGSTWIYLVLLFFPNINAIRVIGRDVTVTAGDDAELFCQVVETAETLTSIRWQRRTKEKPTNTDILTITSGGREHINGLRDRVKFTANFTRMNGSILLSNVTVLDEGIYTCIFSVFPNGPYKTEVHLMAQVPPVVSVSADPPAVAGDADVVLATCTASNAKPAAEVSWSLGVLNNSVKVQNTVIVDSEGRYTVKSSLIVNASKDLNQKNVQCVVTHPGLKDKLELSYTLNVHYPPQVVKIISAGDQGETREFQCEADANPKPTNFTWSRYFPVNETLSSGVNSRLMIQLTPDSNGLYYCEASNQYGKSVGSFYLFFKPYTESKTCWTLYIITVIAGVCCFLILKFNLFQHFIKRLQCIILLGPYLAMMEGLILLQDEEKLNGSCRFCNLTIQFGAPSFHMSILKAIITSSAIRIIGRDVTVTAGDDAELFCQVVETAETLTSIRWQRRTKEKPTNTDILIITSGGKQEYINGLRDRVKFTANFTRMNGSILLSNVTVLDEGIYTCIFSVFPSGPYETEVRLTVQVPPVVSVSADPPAVAGDTDVILATCTASNAKPAAEASWSLGVLNNSVKVQNTVTVDSEGRATVKSSLIVNASVDLNQKNVQCVVTHPGLKEKLELSYTLNVHYPPQVVKIISAGDQGDTREFQCEADANPKPTNFTWSRYFPVKKTLSSGVNSRLMIQLTPDSNGLYYCEASNQYGKSVGSFYLFFKPSTESKTCWTLYIITLIAGVCCFLIWKFNLFQQFIKRLQ